MASPDAPYAGRPAGSKITVKKRGPRLEIDIPPAGFTCGCDPSTCLPAGTPWPVYIGPLAVLAMRGIPVK